jgi:hypothetical protein
MSKSVKDNLFDFIIIDYKKFILIYSELYIMFVFQLYLKRVNIYKIGYVFEIFKNLYCNCK